MSINRDPESLEPVSPSRRGGGSNGSVHSRFSDSKAVPLLLEESYSSLESSLTSSSIGELRSANDFSYISTVS